MSTTDSNVLISKSRTALKALLPPIFFDAVRAIRRARESRHARKVPLEMLRDEEFYRPHFAPWEGLGEFKNIMAKVSQYSEVTADRVWVLRTLGLQACHVPGDFWECGVFRGGTASVLADVAQASPEKQVHLFDTFAGLPEGQADRDFHLKGLYADTSVDEVRKVVGHGDQVVFHAGLIPETFSGLESKEIALAHIDVVLYDSIYDCCSFIYPRLSAGGFMIFDDYGFRSCPGARAAVDDYFEGKPERPLVLPTRQAVVIKLPN